MADAKKPQYKKGITPAGTAKWPKLNTPDEYKGKKSYKVDLVLGDEESADLRATLDAAADEAYEAAKADLQTKIKEGKTGDQKAKAKKALEALTKGVPYTAAVDDDGNETGDFVFKCKANAEYKDKQDNVKPLKLALFDAKKQPTKVQVWGGSRIKVAYSLVPYYVGSANQAGVTIRMEGVQIIELVTGGAGRSADSLGFGEEEGFADEGGEDSAAGDDSGGGEDENPDF